ncbi:MAG: glycosyltransferase family 39 protein [Cytophagales bacterium]|nr:glycosyltransferase family 39 protein [Cytophagales bacterium]
MTFIQIIRRLPIIWMFYLLFVAISTEVLNKFNLIEYKSLIILYAIIIGIILTIILRYKNRIYNKIIFNISGSCSETILCISILIILFSTLFIALYFPPNNWDSMTYHMARVMHWVQNNNIEFYPTHIDRQLFNPPLAEYVILHWFLITGSDIASNMVQYISFIVSLILIANTVQFFGGNKKNQLIGVLMLCTMPQAILQATNTKPDFTMSFLCVCCVHYTLKYLNKFKIDDVAIASLSFGLALFAKSSGIIFLLPILGFLLLYGLLIRKFKSVFYVLLFFAISAATINWNYWQRNKEAFGNIQGPSFNTYYQLNQSYEPNVIISSILKHSSLHICGSFYINYWFSDIIINSFSNFIVEIHKKLAIDINDTNNTLQGTIYNFNRYSNLDEDYAGNFCIFLFFIFTSMYFLITVKNIKNSIFIYFTIGVIISYLFACTILKFSPWHSRLHLPFFLLICISISLYISKLHENIQYIACLICFALAIPYIVMGTPRSIVKDEKLCNKWTRDEWMFIKKGGQPLLDLYQISDTIHKYKYTKIGVIMGADDWDYPLFIILKRNNTDLKLYHINVPEWETPIIIQNKFKNEKLEMIIECNGNSYKIAQK